MGGETLKNLDISPKKRCAAGDLRGGLFISFKKRPPAGRLFKNPKNCAGRGQNTGGETPWAGDPKTRAGRVSPE